MRDYEIVIVGAGAAGLTAAYTAKGFGKRVLLIEEHKPGGECTWSGCIPSKALINVAKEIHTVKKYVDEYEVDTSKALQRVRDVIESVYEEERPEKLIRDGIDYLQGSAKFLDANTLQVKDSQIKAKRIFIATGSSPFVPPIKGIEEVAYFTNENIFKLTTLPKSLVILGGGAIGVELAQALNRLGVKIELVEMMESILAREEASLVQVLQEVLSSEGIKLHLGSKAVEVSGKNNHIELIVDKNNEQTIIKGEGLLVALGRKANIEALDLAKAGISTNKKGIIVNQYLETNVKGVFAIGDVVGPYQFSHMANAQGIRAVQNAIFPLKRKIAYDHVAWCTYTDPEFARAGFTEKEAREIFGDKIRIYEHSYANLDRAKTKPGSKGVVKIICDPKGKVIGASILGERAGELISQVQVIKTMGINLSKLALVIHPYPTYAEVLQKLAKRVVVDNIKAHPLAKLFKK